MAGYHGPMVPLASPMGHRKAEAIAQGIIVAYDPGLLRGPTAFPADDFFEFHLTQKYGLITGAASLPLGVEGITSPNGTLRLSEDTYEALWQGKPRARFTAVHEAVHGIVHMPLLRQRNFELLEGTGVQLYRRQQVPSYVDPEWQASRVAAAVLMPLFAIRKLIAESGENLEAIMDTFQVSYMAAGVRLDQLHRTELI